MKKLCSLLAGLLVLALLCGCAAENEKKPDSFPSVVISGSAASSPQSAESSRESFFIPPVSFPESVSGGDNSEPAVSTIEYSFDEYYENIYPDPDFSSFPPTKQDIPLDPKKPIKYSRKKAVEYAAEHWNSGKSLCAEFASECLNAGGLEIFSQSSSRLISMLESAGLGSVHAVKHNEDGTVNLPEYAKAGDVVFYFCDREYLYAHTVIYAGKTKDGKMRAFSHNPMLDNSSAYVYNSHCTDDCRGRLEYVVLFHFLDWVTEGEEDYPEKPESSEDSESAESDESTEITESSESAESSENDESSESTDNSESLDNSDNGESNDESE